MKKRETERERAHREEGEGERSVEQTMKTRCHNNRVLK